MQARTLSDFGYFIITNLQTQQNLHHRYLHRQTNQGLRLYHQIHSFTSFYSFKSQNYLQPNNLIYLVILKEVHLLKYFIPLRNIVHWYSLANQLEPFISPKFIFLTWPHCYLDWYLKILPIFSFMIQNYYFYLLISTSIHSF